MSKSGKFVYVIVVVHFLLLSGCASLFTSPAYKESKEPQIVSAPESTSQQLKNQIVDLAEHIRDRESELLAIPVRKPEEIPTGLKGVRYYLDKAAATLDSAQYPDLGKYGHLDKDGIHKDIRSISQAIENIINLETKPSK